MEITRRLTFLKIRLSISVRKVKIYLMKLFLDKVL